MENRSPIKTILLFFTLIATVIVLSTISNRIWGGKPEKVEIPHSIAITEEMTVKEFGEANNLPNPVLKGMFGLQQKSDLQNKVTAYGSPEEIKSRVTKKMALASEHQSKNWQKILIKFAAWFSFMLTVYFLFKKNKVTARSRNTVLFSSVIIFGVVLGADPSPMGTVKDAIHLFAASGAIFPPRLIALTVFLLIVFLANKYICSWGCQAGTLQDLVFRLNQGGTGQAHLGRQFKIPFIVTNTFRVGFLVVFTIAAFTVGADIFEPIDPFKLFKPVHLGIVGGAFAGGLLLLSLFVYRPWCHFFCPFGLAGWIVEKFSRVKISVDYETCIGCEKCESVCPSTVMGAILKQDKKTIPDCFSCYACREACPTGSICYSSRKRIPIPANHFDKVRKN